ncbi:Zinc finger and BTB domain-containing protein 24 [Eumeta japonica]|uniref:Zinc finger and BTB domain-containing protein 24 n=1 Tax=Eumeta variegata TaxID=151549 RepID=A0A4C1TGD3_EUMVA|nr:Zinc finger and BTB domain-containing protein 24 [Eumeta japonica]
MRLTCCETLTTSKAMDWSALTTGSNKAEYLAIKLSGKNLDEEDNFKAIVSLNKTRIQFIEVGKENSGLETLFVHVGKPDEIEKHNAQSSVFYNFDADIAVDLKTEDNSEHMYDDELIEASQSDVIVKDENIQENHILKEDNLKSQHEKFTEKVNMLPSVNRNNSEPDNISVRCQNDNKPGYVYENCNKKICQVGIKNENIEHDSSTIDKHKFKNSRKPALKLKKKTRKHLTNNAKASSQSTEEYCQVIYLTEEQCLEERNKMLSQNKYLKAPYKCEDCVKGYVYKESYEKHMISHSEKSGNHQCDICKQRRRTKNLLLKHRTLHFRQYSCKLCKYTRLSPVSIDEHYNAVHSSHLLYECSLCNKKYWKRTLLKKHIAYKHSECARVACDLCGKTYVNAYSLRTHVHTVHATETDTPPARKEHVCAHCGAAFRHASLLRAHSVKHTDNRLFYCVECDK